MNRDSSPMLLNSCLPETDLQRGGTQPAMDICPNTSGCWAILKWGWGGDSPPNLHLESLKGANFCVIDSVLVLDAPLGSMIIKLQLWREKSPSLGHMSSVQL